MSRYIARDTRFQARDLSANTVKGLILGSSRSRGSGGGDGGAMEAAVAIGINRGGRKAKDGGLQEGL